MKIKNLSSRSLVAIPVLAVLLTLSPHLVPRQAKLDDARKSALLDLGESLNQNNPPKIKAALTRFQSHPAWLQSTQQIVQLINYYNTVGDEDLRKSIIVTLAGSKDHRAGEFLSKIAKVEGDVELRRTAEQEVAELKMLPLNDRMDLDKYIEVDNSVLTLKDAKPVLESKLNSNVKDRIYAVKKFSLFGDKLKGDPIIDKIMNMYTEVKIGRKVDLVKITAADRDKLELKLSILVTLAESKDSRATQFLKQLPGEDSSFFKSFAQKVYQNSNSSAPNYGGSQQSNVIHLEGKVINSKDIANKAQPIIKSGQYSKVNALLRSLERDPRVINGTEAFDVLTNLYEYADTLKDSSGNSLKIDKVDNIRERIARILTLSEDIRSIKFFLSMKQRDDNSLSAPAKDSLEDIMNSEPTSGDENEGGCCGG